METIATIGTLGSLIIFLHLRLERRLDRLEACFDRLDAHFDRDGSRPAA